MPRPDSVIEGASVHEARLRAGAFLALEHPVTGGYSNRRSRFRYRCRHRLFSPVGYPYGIGFIKNKYIGRTFISPGQSSREDKVRIKLNAVASVVKGKRVVLIDDSIVRGTTSGRIVKLLRDAGATEVHMRVSAPPFLNPCYYGTDIDSRETPYRLSSFDKRDQRHNRHRFARLSERGKRKEACGTRKRL